MAFWYCLRHMRVEGDDGCAHAERMGPYATSDEASEALATARAKNREWDRADADWDADLED